MEERIKQIRKYHKLTQTEFGEKIGLKGNTITTYETGLRIPSESVLMSICREFGVNREWLEHGTGEMFDQSANDAQINRIARQYSDDRTFRAILEVYMRMSDRSKEMFAEYVCQLSDAIRQRNALPTPEQLEAAADALENHNQITG